MSARRKSWLCMMADGEDGLDVTLDCILPLLVWGRSLMGAVLVVGLVDFLGECGAEGAVKVAT